MKKLLSYLIAITLISCSAPVEENTENSQAEILKMEFPYSIDVVSALQNRLDFKLSDFGDKIHYVPLKGLPEVPISFLLDVEITDDDIFALASHEIGILRYNKAGELINRIGKYGNGPGELSLGSRFSLSTEEKLVYVQRNYTYNVLGFTYDGQFTGVLSTDKKKLGFYTFPLSADRILRLGTIHPAPEAIPPGLYEMALFDGENNIIHSIPTELENTPEWRSGPIVMHGVKHYSRSPTWFEKRLHYKAFSSDTVYEASLDSIYPKYILDKGNVGPPVEAESIIQKGPYGDPDNFLYNECIFETSYWLLFRASLHGNDYIVRVNKLTGDLESMECIGCVYYKRRDKAVVFNIQNDIDGGISFYPHFTNRQGDTWIYSISALDFIEQMDELAEDGKIDLSDRSIEPVKIYHSISEDDNPILMFLDLKK